VRRRIRDNRITATDEDCLRQRRRLRQQRTWPEAKREPVISTIPHFGNRDDVEQF
jgi:hypothetical protein